MSGEITTINSNAAAESAHRIQNDRRKWLIGQITIIALLTIGIAVVALQEFHVIDYTTPLNNFISNPMPTINIVGQWLIKPVFGPAFYNFEFIILGISAVGMAKYLFTKTDDEKKLDAEIKETKRKEQELKAKLKEEETLREDIRKNSILRIKNERNLDYDQLNTGQLFIFNNGREENQETDYTFIYINDHAKREIWTQVISSKSKEEYQKLLETFCIKHSKPLIWEIEETKPKPEPKPEPKPLAPTSRIEENGQIILIPPKVEQSRIQTAQITRKTDEDNNSGKVKRSDSLTVEITSQKDEDDNSRSGKGKVVNNEMVGDQKENLEATRELKKPLSPPTLVLPSTEVSKTTEELIDKLRKPSAQAIASFATPPSAKKPNDKSQRDKLFTTPPKVNNSTDKIDKTLPDIVYDRDKVVSNPEIPRVPETTTIPKSLRLLNANREMGITE